MSGDYKDEPEEAECPICLDELDLTDRSFKPCKCGYQMCRFCWNHINENLNGRCPACRQLYKTENYKFTPPNQEEIQRIQNAKKAKERERKQAEVTARKKLANVRVIQRNLVYVTNLALSAASEETLEKTEYFGRFGKIKKIVVNRNNVYQGPQGPSVSAYITFLMNKDALAAIKSVDGTLVDGRLLRASFGTTKYCSYFLRSMKCPNPDCMYLHDLGADEDSFTKEDMAQGKHLLSIESQEEESEESKDYNRGNKKDNLTKSLPNNKLAKQNPGAWKTELNNSAHSSLNPDEWPDALSAKESNKKKRNQTVNKPRSPIPEAEPDVPQPNIKSALPATASWASKMPNSPEDEKSTNKDKNDQSSPSQIRNENKQNQISSSSNSQDEPEVEQIKIRKNTPKKQTVKKTQQKANTKAEDSIDNENNTQSLTSKKEVESLSSEEDTFTITTDSQTKDDTKESKQESQVEIEEKPLPQKNTQDNGNQNNVIPENFSLGFDWLRELIEPNSESYSNQDNQNPWQTPFFYKPVNSTKSRFDFAREDDGQENHYNYTPQQLRFPSQSDFNQSSDHKSNGIIPTESNMEPLSLALEREMDMLQPNEQFIREAGNRNVPFLEDQNIFQTLFPNININYSSFNTQQYPQRVNIPQRMPQHSQQYMGYDYSMNNLNMNGWDNPMMQNGIQNMQAQKQQMSPMKPQMPQKMRLQQTYINNNIQENVWRTQMTNIDAQKNGQVQYHNNFDSHYHKKPTTQQRQVNNQTHRVPHTTHQWIPPHQSSVTFSPLQNSTLYSNSNGSNSVYKGYTLSSEMTNNKWNYPPSRFVN